MPLVSDTLLPVIVPDTKIYLIATAALTNAMVIERQIDNDDRSLLFNAVTLNIGHHRATIVLLNWLLYSYDKSSPGKMNKKLQEKAYRPENAMQSRLQIFEHANRSTHFIQKLYSRLNMSYHQFRTSACMEFYIQRTAQCCSHRK